MYGAVVSLIDEQQVWVNGDYQVVRLVRIGAVNLRLPATMVQAIGGRFVVVIDSLEVAGFNQRVFVFGRLIQVPCGYLEVVEIPGTDSRGYLQPLVNN